MEEENVTASDACMPSQRHGQSQMHTVCFGDYPRSMRGRHVATLLVMTVFQKGKLRGFTKSTLSPKFSGARGAELIANIEIINIIRKLI